MDVAAIEIDYTVCSSHASEAGDLVPIFCLAEFGGVRLKHEGVVVCVHNLDCISSIRA